MPEALAAAVLVEHEGAVEPRKGRDRLLLLLGLDGEGDLVRKFGKLGALLRELGAHLRHHRNERLHVLVLVRHRNRPAGVREGALRSVRGTLRACPPSAPERAAGCVRYGCAKNVFSASLA